VITGVSDPLGLAVARSLAAPGAQLHLLGGASRQLAQAADDCRQRGALVDVHPSFSGARPEIPARLTDFDGDTSPDLLVISSDLAAAAGMSRGSGAEDPLTAVIELMRQRRAGRVILVCAISASTVEASPAAMLRALRVWLDDGIALRRRLKVDGVRVSIVAPSALAVRLASRLRVPRLAAVNVDRIAELAAGSNGRMDGTIKVPGAWELLRRTLRALPSATAAGVRALLPSNEVGEGPADDAPVAEETGTGD
jgi:NAD(P)-dependent dehydrogenase (short-subunit alcohol dehydrogenase family)